MNSDRMNTQLTLLIVSYDGYSDMWPNFFKCLEKYWPDCPYPIVLANNEKSFEAKNLRVINCGKEAQWSTRTRIALEQIDTKYVCFLLEDLFVSDNVLTVNFENAITLMEHDKINYYKLMTFSKNRTSNYKFYQHLNVIPGSLPYGISLLAAIWNRDYFLNMVGKTDYNPWVFEVKRLQEERLNTEPNKIVGVFDNRSILNICHMVVQGKYLPNSVKLMESKGFQFDTQSRKVMTRTEYVHYSIKSFFSPFFNKYPKFRRLLKVFGIHSVVQDSIDALK